ncbi:hypothetical protein B0T21DRAFT_406887 [Apiosordaria backusii]|uniref:Uncharacterized protein n=1 Tax=Apiosordaria backusii TaxID=314023 RepID=A0AA40EZD5_9PEZI|nr:hypothetical protein B0T21DRAFT_406887 [Apiosordaria backusii]
MSSERATPLSELEGRQQAQTNWHPGQCPETMNWTLQVSPGATSILPIPTLGFQVQVLPLAVGNSHPSTGGRGGIPTTIHIIAVPSLPPPPQQFLAPNNGMDMQYNSPYTSGETMPATQNATSGLHPSATEGHPRIPSAQVFFGTNDAQVNIQPGVDRRSQTHRGRAAAPTNNQRGRQMRRADRARSRSPPRADRSQHQASKWRNRSPVRQGRPSRSSASVTQQHIASQQNHRADDDPHVRIRNYKTAIEEDYRCLKKLERNDQKLPPEMLHVKKDQCYTRLRGHQNSLRELEAATGSASEAVVLTTTGEANAANPYPQHGAEFGVSQEMTAREIIGQPIKGQFKQRKHAEREETVGRDTNEFGFIGPVQPSHRVHEDSDLAIRQHEMLVRMGRQEEEWIRRERESSNSRPVSRE